jgi:hypothetical protein
LDAITQQLGILIIVTTLVLTVVVTQFVRVRKNLVTLRAIPAFESLSSLVGLVIESNRPLHLSFGSSALGDEATPLTLAGAELFYQVARLAAIGDLSPIITLSDSSALPVGQDVLRRAYSSRNRVNPNLYNSVRWYPAGNSSIAFAAALTTLPHDDQISANILAGRFGTEVALILEAGARHDLPAVAVSDSLEGQAVAYAFSSEILIGEEIFAAGTYLSDSSAQRGATITIDVLRWLLVAVLFGGLIIALLNGA